MEVDLQGQGAEYLPGRVVRVNANGSVDVQLLEKDGHTPGQLVERGLPPTHVLSAEPQSPPQQAGDADGGGTMSMVVRLSPRKLCGGAGHGGVGVGLGVLYPQLPVTDPLTLAPRLMQEWRQCLSCFDCFFIPHTLLITFICLCVQYCHINS